MTEWISVNIPWAISKESEAKLETKRLMSEFFSYIEEQSLQRFGPKPEIGTKLEDLDLDQLESVYPGLLDARAWTCNTQLDQFIATCDDPLARQIARWRFYLECRTRFEMSDPTCLKYRVRIEHAFEQEKTGQFQYHPACKPGVVIDVLNRYGVVNRLVIGDVNAAGFRGDEYQFLDESYTVLRYLDLTSFY